ncbi:MAG: BamA/TamA family outer membrane protein, partial [Gemmatimonadota bacterium]|nr:BamA/TamA family outer membrane protein [Gemmatimonadota bacterium]
MVVNRALLPILRALLAVAVVASPLAAQREERVVRQLDFEGNDAITDQTLASVISTTNSSFFATAPLLRLLGLGEKRFFDQTEFERDVIRLGILYKRSGYPNVSVDTVVERKPGDIYLTFVIDEGPPVLVDSLTINGVDSLPAEDREDLLVDLPLLAGDVFDRYLMQATADTIARRLRDGGYPGAEVFTSFATQAGELTADVTFDVEPGEPAVFGSVRVEGLDRVDSSVVVDLMAARPGREFRQSDLFESQRNLYSSDLFRIATVGIDSSRYEFGADSVPVVVQVAEARRYRVRGSGGYGTNDCFRGTAGLGIRNFMGRGRILDITTRVSKLGVGAPADWGLEEGICPELAEDSVGSRLLNYGVNVAFRRPAFLSPNNTITYSVFAERRSEFRAYMREDVGGNVTVARETPNRRLPISLGYTLSYGKTEATAATFCAFFNTCLGEDIARLRERRRFAMLTATGALPRVNNTLDPSRGYLAQLELSHASRLIGSSELLEFTRGVAEASWYRPIGRETVLSWRVKGGLIFAPEIASGSLEGIYIPPDQRFYAGGPSDVRGYRRNELGPVIYVVPSDAVNGG